MEGWWLCSMRGRQGICPGNRLRLIPGYYEDNSSRGPSPQMQFSDMRGIHAVNNIRNEMNSMHLHREGKRRSWPAQPNKVITPRRYNDVYLYDMPPSRCSPIPVPSVSPSCHSQSSDYDVPPKAVPVFGGYRGSPALSCISPVSKDGSQDSYDVPRPLLHSQNMLTPSSSASSLSLTGESFSSSNRSSLINMPDYDVPRPHPKGPQLVLQHQQAVYDVPPPSHAVIKELPLEIGSALDALERLQTETTGAISRLLSFVTADWRTCEKLEGNILEIKLVVIRLKTSLHDFKEFCEGALGNATRATDKNLASKLVTLVMALRTADKLIHDAAERLDHQGWDVRTLARPGDDDKYKPDELEQIIACTRSLTEDIRQAASFIQGNSTLLFKKDSATASQPAQTNERLDDYDYVNLESKEAYAKANSEIRDEMPKDLRKNYDCMIKNVEETVLKDINPDDKHILTFYAHQTTEHHGNLTQAIDAFFQTLEHNQPPKIFLAHGKFIVLSAHKLVHIGDAVGRSVSNAEIKTRASSCANNLSAALATNVAKTKQAALQFPSVTAVQEMVDSVVDISYVAKELKQCLVQAAQP
ncbi:enhancer of filamentation 1 isoform X2 [Atheta coriaria]